MDPLAKSGRRYTIAAVILLVGLLIFYEYSSGTRLDILPGFEGMQNGLNGYQVRSNTETGLGDPLPAPQGACYYKWGGSPSITSAAVTVQTAGVGGCGVLASFGTDTVVADAQENPVSSENPLTTGQKVNYYVPVPGQPGQYQYVTGQVEVYSYGLDVSDQSGSAGNWNFGGDTLWYNLYSEIWNQASTDPNNASVKGSTFETPLYAVVSNVNWQNQGSSDVDAALVGHAFTFYSSPSTTGQTLATLANPVTQNVNSSLGSQYAPDSRFQRLVYYPISITSLKPTNENPVTGCLAGCTFPTVHITVTLYTLRIGEYILTNPSTQGLGNRNQNCTGFIGCGVEWFENPFNQILAALGVGLGLFVIILIFATPVVVALIALYANGRKKSL